MKAAYIESCGAAEATIQYGDLPEPKPTGTQVLVKHLDDIGLLLDAQAQHPAAVAPAPSRSQLGTS